MKLTKERARAPIIESGSLSGGLSYDSDAQAATFTVSCHGPWVQGKGHEVSYTLHLTKAEMLITVTQWLTDFERFERETAKP